MSAPAWLEHVQLVTFDCFGTLLDWRAAMEKVEIRGRDEFDKFELEARKLAEGDPYLRFVDVLKQAIAKVKPALRPAIVGLFADDFGRAPAFADSVRGVAQLKDLLKVGVVANCDAHHMLDVLAALRTPLDVTVTAQEVRAYKPTDRAWDAIVRLGVARSAATRDGWMHVSAFERYDLGPARNRGLKTCLLKRPGGDDKALCDLTVGSLDELVGLIAEAKRGPLVLEVETKPAGADGAVMQQVRQWLAETELAAMRAVPGVRAAALFEREDGALVEHYTFGGKSELDNFDANFAPEHRAAVRDQFGRQVERATRVVQIKGRA
jgi:2-haloalkanoic acid dehalogenase type II